MLIGLYISILRSRGKPTTLFPSALGKQDNAGEGSKENNPF